MIGIFRGHKLIMPLLLVGVAFFGWLLHRNNKTDMEGYLPVIPEENVPNIEPSISSVKASQIANNLHSAMRGYGTRNDEIKEIVFSVNPRDWKMINDAFGYRHYSRFFGIEEAPIPGTRIGDYHNLRTWLKSELHIFYNSKIYKRVKELYFACQVEF